jgi:DnaK suppressor protein
MNADQLAFFKHRLEQMLSELVHNAGQTTENLRDSVVASDPADRATIEEELALELRTRDRERKLLSKVRKAIACIESGEYGWCEETGEPIGIPRLLARPTTTLSLEAQERREMRQKLFGD